MLSRISRFLLYFFVVVLWGFAKSELLYLDEGNFELVLTNYAYVVVVFYDDSEESQKLLETMQSVDGLIQKYGDGSVEITAVNALTMSELDDLVVAYDLDIPCVRILKSGVFQPIPHEKLRDPALMAEFIIDDSRPATFVAESWSELWGVLARSGAPCRPGKQNNSKPPMSIAAIGIFPSVAESDTSDGVSEHGHTSATDEDPRSQFDLAAESLRGVAAFVSVQSDDPLQLLRNLYPALAPPPHGTWNDNGNGNAAILLLYLSPYDGENDRASSDNDDGDNNGGASASEGYGTTVTGYDWYLGDYAEASLAETILSVHVPWFGPCHRPLPPPPPPALPPPSSRNNREHDEQQKQANSYAHANAQAHFDDYFDNGLSSVYLRRGSPVEELRASQYFAAKAIKVIAWLPDIATPLTGTIAKIRPPETKSKTKRSGKMGTRGGSSGSGSGSRYTRIGKDGEEESEEDDDVDGVGAYYRQQVAAVHRAGYRWSKPASVLRTKTIIQTQTQTQTQTHAHMNGSVSTLLHQPPPPLSTGGSNRKNIHEGSGDGGSELVLEVFYRNTNTGGLIGGDVDPSTVATFASTSSTSASSAPTATILGQSESATASGSSGSSGSRTRARARVGRAAFSVVKGGSFEEVTSFFGLGPVLERMERGGLRAFAPALLAHDPVTDTKYIYLAPPLSSSSSEPLSSPSSSSSSSFSSYGYGGESGGGGGDRWRHSFSSMIASKAGVLPLDIYLQLQQQKQEQEQEQQNLLLSDPIPIDFPLLNDDVIEEFVHGVVTGAYPPSIRSAPLATSNAAANGAASAANGAYNGASSGSTVAPRGGRGGAGLGSSAFSLESMGKLFDTMMKLLGLGGGSSSGGGGSSSSSLGGASSSSRSSIIEAVGLNVVEVVAGGVECDVILVVYAPWCGYCRDILPTFESLARAFSAEPRIRVVKIDGTANDLPSSFNVRGFPAVLYFSANDKRRQLQQQQQQQQGQQVHHTHSVGSYPNGTDVSTNTSGGNQWDMGSGGGGRDGRESQWGVPLISNRRGGGKGGNSGKGKYPPPYLQTAFSASAFAAVAPPRPTRHIDAQLNLFDLVRWVQRHTSFKQTQTQTQAQTRTTAIAPPSGELATAGGGGQEYSQDISSSATRTTTAGAAVGAAAVGVGVGPLQVASTEQLGSIAQDEEEQRLHQYEQEWAAIRNQGRPTYRSYLTDLLTPLLLGGGGGGGTGTGAEAGSDQAPKLPLWLPLPPGLSHYLLDAAKWGGLFMDWLAGEVVFDGKRWHMVVLLLVVVGQLVSSLFQSGGGQASRGSGSGRGSASTGSNGSSGSSGGKSGGSSSGKSNSGNKDPAGGGSNSSCSSSSGSGSGGSSKAKSNATKNSSTSSSNGSSSSTRRRAEQRK